MVADRRASRSTTSESWSDFDLYSSHVQAKTTLEQSSAILIQEAPFVCIGCHAHVKISSASSKCLQAIGLTFRIIGYLKTLQANKAWPVLLQTISSLTPCSPQVVLKHMWLL